MRANGHLGRILIFVTIWMACTAASRGDVLSLRDCLELALAGNHDLKAIEQEGEAGTARAEGAKRERYPELFATANWQSHLEPTRVGAITSNGQTGTFTRNLWQAGAGLTVPVYTGGRLQAREQAEALLAQAAELDTTTFREQLAVQVAEVYHGMLALGSLVKSLDRSRMALEAQETQIKALVREEKAAEVDLLRIQVRMATLEQQRIEVRNEESILRTTMNVLMARPARTAWDPEDALAGTSGTQDPSEAHPETFAERADEAAARQRQMAAGSLAEAARGDALPALQLEASWSVRGDRDGHESFDDGIVGLSVRWDFWDSGRTRQAVLEAKARERAQAQRLAAIRSRRQVEWEQARDSLNAAEERLRVARLSVDSAREAQRIEQRKYDSGKGLISDVLSAEAAALEAESLLAKARADRLNALARCDHARGTIFTGQAWLPAFKNLSAN